MSSQNTSHSSPTRVRYEMCFVNLNRSLYSASVTAVMYTISFYIGPCCNGTWLYAEMMLTEEMHSTQSHTMKVTYSYLDICFGSYMPIYVLSIWTQVACGFIQNEFLNSKESKQNTVDLLQELFRTYSGNKYIQQVSSIARSYEILSYLIHGSSSQCW